MNQLIPEEFGMLEIIQKKEEELAKLRKQIWAQQATIEEYDIVEKQFQKDIAAILLSDPA